MSQGDNDLAQLKQCRKDLAGVYKSQVHDNISDNGNLATLHSAVLNVGSVIQWLERKLAENNQ